MNRILLCAIVAIVPAAAAAQTAPAAQTTPSAQAQTQAAPPADAHAGHAPAQPARAAEKEVCKMSKPAGSHVRRVKTCMKASDWRRQESSTRDDIKRAQESARPMRDR